MAMFFPLVCHHLLALIEITCPIGWLGLPDLVNRGKNKTEHATDKLSSARPEPSQAGAGFKTNEASQTAASIWSSLLMGKVCHRHPWQTADRSGIRKCVSGRRLDVSCFFLLLLLCILHLPFCLHCPSIRRLTLVLRGEKKASTLRHARW